MPEHLSPETLSIYAENLLICEKLLGWRYYPCGSVHYRERTVELPLSFTDWAGAGLILDALQGSELKPAGRACESLAHELIDGLLTPALVRAAALEYIRSLP